MIVSLGTTAIGGCQRDDQGRTGDRDPVAGP
jgi:hypothetical protein